MPFKYRTGKGSPTIDLQELYVAILKRQCDIGPLTKTYGPTYNQATGMWEEVWGLIKITEDNGVTYTIRLYENQK